MQEFRATAGPLAFDELAQPLSVAKCQEATYAAQQNCVLFDHFVGAGEQLVWNLEAKRFVTAKSSAISNGTRLGKQNEDVE